MDDVRVCVGAERGLRRRDEVLEEQKVEEVENE